MSRWLPEDPVKVCGKQFANTTIQFHECLCQFNYASNQRKLGVLKFKHCALADELRKEINFNMYQIIGFSVLVFFIASIILFMSFKWYQKTKKNPCACLFSCCCSSEKKAKHVSSAHCNGTGHDVHDSNAGFDENWVHEMNVDVGSFHHHNGLTNGHGLDSYQHRNGKGTRKKTFCMNFCLSEPVQDCCEFFDCDLLWRKKAIYSQPYFGRPRRTDSVQGELNGAYALKGGPPSQFSAAGGSQLHQQEPSTLQRRPTRPAPPPPQLPGAPGSALHNVPMFDDGSHIVDDDIVCEPIPEAPPSPEPVRKTQPDQPRSIYVDPLAFLQRPFLRLSIALSGRDANQRDSKADGGEGEDSEALYSRVKDYVLSRVHRSKSGSVLSLNRGAGGVSNHPDGGGELPSKSKANYRKGGSLASLHNIAEATLGKTFGGSKHSISAASLNMLDDTLHTHLGPSGNVSRCGSRQDLADEDVPPNGRDEYIDLEEMARKMAARAAQQQQQISQQHGNECVPDVRSVVTSQPLSVQGLQRAVEHPHDTSSSYPSSQTSPTGSSRTPDFIPASAYAAPQATVHQVGRNTQPAGAAFEIGPSGLYPNQNSQSQTVPTVSNQIFTSNSDSQDATSTSSAFAQANFTSFQRDPTVQQSQQSSVVPTVRDGKPSVLSRPNNVTVPTPSPPVTGSVVPYTGPTHIASSSTSPYVPLSQVLSTPNGTLGRSKPSVPPRPNALNDNPNYKSLGRPSIGPPSPKVIDPRAAHAAALAAASMPHSPMMSAGRPAMVPNMAPSISPIRLHEQQILQQQLLQQQLYLQQNPHLNPAMQQLILQQQLLHEHTIMTPAVQQQMLQEQQMYQQMLQHQQHYQLQQQYQHHLQQQLLQQQLHHGMRYRQPLSSTSSTASSTSSKSSRSIHKPNHPPPPPPLHVPPPHPSSNSSLGGAPIESSI